MSVECGQAGGEKDDSWCGPPPADANEKVNAINATAEV